MKSYAHVHGATFAHALSFCHRPDAFTGPLVFMITYVMRRLKDFLLIVIVILVGFVASFRHLTQGVDDDAVTVDDDQYNYDTMIFTLRSMFFTMLGDVNISPFSVFDFKTRVLANILYALYIFIVSIVLLNLLIGIIGENYSTALQGSRARWRSEQAQIVRDVLSLRKFFDKYVCSCCKSDATPFFIHEFRKKDALDNEDQSSSVDKARETDSKLLDDDNSEQGSRTTELLECIQRQILFNAAQGKDNGEVKFDDTCKLTTRFNASVTHKKWELKPVEAILRNSTLRRVDFVCDNCGRDKKTMASDEVYFASTTITREVDAIALCFYCARLPEKLRVGCVKGPDDKDLKLLLENPYGSKAGCDVCSREIMTKATSDPETDNSVVWHGKVSGQGYDVCGPCAYQYMEENKKEDEEEEKGFEVPDGFDVHQLHDDLATIRDQFQEASGDSQSITFDQCLKHAEIREWLDDGQLSEDTLKQFWNEYVKTGESSISFEVGSNFLFPSPVVDLRQWFHAADVP